MMSIRCSTSHSIPSSIFYSAWLRRDRNPSVKLNPTVESDDPQYYYKCFVAKNPMNVLWLWISMLLSRIMILACGGVSGNKSLWLDWNLKFERWILIRVWTTVRVCLIGVFIIFWCSSWSKAAFIALSLSCLTLILWSNWRMSNQS